MYFTDLGNWGVVRFQKNNWITPSSRVLLEKLTVSQLVKKFPEFYGTRRFIAAFTSARQLDPVHTPTSHFLKIHLNIILPFTLVSPKWSLSLRFPYQNPVYACPLPHTCYVPCPSHSSLFYHPHNIGWAVRVIKFLIMYFSSLPCYIIPLRPKYYPQHPILENPKPTFLPQCERPRFTTIQNNRLNYSSVYLDLHIFGQQTEG